MGFKEDLDKYLTTPPNNGFESYCDSVWDCIADDIAEHMMKSDFDGSNTETMWFEKLQNRLKYVEEHFDQVKGVVMQEYGDLTIKDIAQIIERAYKRFFINK